MTHISLLFQRYDKSNPLCMINRVQFNEDRIIMHYQPIHLDLYLLMDEIPNL